MTWPSTFNAGTLGYMLDRMDDQLGRVGTVTTQLQACVNDAILTYQRERFRFNETFTTTFQTVVGQQNYNVFSDASFPNIASAQQIYKIDWMTITLPPAVFDVPRIEPEEILILTQTGTQMGQPYAFAFSNETIMLYPVPSANTNGCQVFYTMTIGAHVTYQVPASLTDSANRWMIDGERLIRSRGLYEFALNYSGDQDMIKKMSPFPPDLNGGFVGASYDAYEMLKAEVNRLQRRGVIRPMHF